MDTVSIILYIGGNVIVRHGTVNYSIKGVKLIRISRSTKLCELIEIVQRKLDIDGMKSRFNLSTKYSYMDRSRLVEAHVVLDDDTLQFMLDPNSDVQCIELYIECETIVDNAVANVLESYMPCITQGLSMIGFDQQAGTSTADFHEDVDQPYTSMYNFVGDWDQYIIGCEDKDNTRWPNDMHGWNFNTGINDSFDRNVSQVSFETILDFGCSGHGVVADSSGHVIDAVPPDEETPHQMFADSALQENPESENEPDTPPGDDSDNEGNENAFENIVEQVHDTTSNVFPIDVSNLHEMPQFFSVVYEEQCPDSIGVSSGSQSSFYNPEKGELHKNMIFRNKKELIAAVKDFSVRCVRREYRVVESTPTIWKVCCKNRSSSMDCGWGLRACLKANLGYFKITKYGDRHTCISSQVGIDHRNLYKNMIASDLIGIVHCNPSCEIKYVKQIIKDKYGYEISYAKALYSLRRAVEKVYGTWESSVRILPMYMGALMKYNPGTIIEWRHFPTCNPSVKVLNYVFWAFRPCVDGFRYFRKIISIDGTHLYTKYKHKMLIAVGLDANNQVLPLAFALVDEESYDSWKWFLDLLCVHVIAGLPGVCLISDRHRAIISAIKGIPQFNPPRGAHRFCLRHVCSNFNSQFKNVHLKDLCWQAGSQHQVRKFDDIMNEIKNKKQRAYIYLSEIDKQKWTLAHDGGWRFGIMTTNMSECLNGVLKGARRLPITAIVKMTFQRCAEYFIDHITRCQRMIQNKQPWPDYVFRKYEKWSVRSNEHSVSRIEIRAKQATVKIGGRPGRGKHVQVATLTTHECSCGKWTMFGIPCSHAICTAKHFGLDPSIFVQPWFQMSAYVNTYEGRFHAIQDDHYWDTPSFELHHNPVRRQRQRAGRNRTTRIRNELDQPTVRDRERLERENASRQ